LYLLENSLQLALALEIQRHEDRRPNLLGQRFHVGLRLVVEIGDGDLGPERAEGLGAPPCDRLIVGDAGYQRLLSLEQRQRRRIDHARFSFSRADACSRSTRSVWLAIISSSSVGMTQQGMRDPWRE